MKTLSHAGERELIARIKGLVEVTDAAGRRDIALGIGDDCAVTVWPGAGEWDCLLTSDAVIEGVHFEPQADPAAIGHKAMGRCLSDVAAMGGEPCWALVNLAAPAATPLERIDAIMAGLAATAAACSTAVVGGDVAAGSELALHVFLVGRVPAGTAVRRDGARPGDVLFVTGALGGSLSGRHLTFEPRLAEGAWLRKGAWATAMIDLSDGLGLDARRLLEACGAAGRIYPDRIPVTAAAGSQNDGRPALEHALSDGEDYELLFAVKNVKKDAMIKAWHEAGLAAPCTRIGEIVAGPAGALEIADATGRRFVAELGYEHFGASKAIDPFA